MNEWYFAMLSQKKRGSYMRVKINIIGGALHPSERIVSVSTVSGEERLVVDDRSIKDESLSVGSPISQQGENLLVELPRETLSGLWRVWVKRKLLVDDKVHAA